MLMDRKRGRDAASNANGLGTKKPRDMDSFQPGIGSKSKPCTKFFSTAGCPFGEGCHFQHYVPGGINVVSQMNMGNPVAPPPPRNPMISDGGAAPMKTKMCNKYNTTEGCKFGQKCHFAHGERELGRSTGPGHDDRPYGGAPMVGRMPGHRFEPPPAPPAGNAAAASFGQSATAKISVDASLAGAIIGKGGVNSKQICRVTGAKLSIKDHETDTNLKNIELEGTFDQIKQASAMVRELIVNISATAPPHHPPKSAGGTPAGNFKTKLCDNFSKGTCTFGDRCHFAHGANELRKSGTA